MSKNSRNYGAHDVAESKNEDNGIEYRPENFGNDSAAIETEKEYVDVEKKMSIKDYPEIKYDEIFLSNKLYVEITGSHYLSGKKLLAISEILKIIMINDGSYKVKVNEDNFDLFMDMLENISIIFVDDYANIPYEKLSKIKNRFKSDNKKIDLTIR